MTDWWDDPEVAKTAHAVAKRFRGYTEAEDIKSELVVWCLGNESTAERVWAGPLWFRQRRLWTIAQRFARKEKARALGYEIEDEFFYSPSVVRHLLPDAFDVAATPPAQGIASIKVGNGGGNQSRGFEWETIISDVRRALKLLSKDDHDLIYALYSGRGCTLTAYCGKKEWDYRKGVRAERRAMRRLIDLLGGTSPWVEDITEPPREGPSEARRDEKTPEAIHG